MSDVSTRFHEEQPPVLARQALRGGKSHREHGFSTASLLLATTAIGAACNERPTESDDCYARHEALYNEHPHLDPARLSLTAWSCDWGEAERGPTGLPLARGSQDELRPITASFEVTADDPCDPCAVERLDALLRSAFEARCPGCSYEEFTRGCYAAPEDTNTQYCSVAGLVASPCNPQESHCRPP